MEERITSVQVVILWLSFTSVTTGNLSYQVRPTNAPNQSRPDTPSEAVEYFGKIYHLRATNTLQETTEESVRNLYDGNRPDDGTLLTHEHVDQTIGFVPPTKRVKKILPPFAAANDATKLSKRETLTNKTETTLVTNIIDTVTEESKKNYVFNLKPLLREESNQKKDEKVSNENPPQGGLSNPETTTGTLTKVYSFEREGKLSSTQSPPPNLNIGSKTGIETIVLVPKEHDVLPVAITDEKGGQRGEEEEEEEEKESSRMEKSIWDLLRERKKVRESETLDEGTLHLEKNESETRTPEMRASEKTPFDHFDADSAEIEWKMRNIKMDNSNLHLDSSYALPWLSSKASKPEIETQQEKKNNLTDDAWLKKMTEMAKLLQLSRDEDFLRRRSINIITNDQADEPETLQSKPAKWFLFLLAGNVTIIQLRRHDFTKYLKVNLAARLSIEYDDVRVNKLVIIPPKILVNVTVFASLDHIGDKGEKSLIKMTATNATLLELSGEEYHLVRFFSIDSLKPEAHRRVKSSAKTDFLGDVEFIFYTFLGSCCACALIFLFLFSLNKYFQKMRDLDWPWLDLTSPALRPDRSEPPNRDDLNRISPSVIFSRRFSETQVASDRSPSALWTDLESPVDPPQCTPPSVPISDRDDHVPPTTKLHIYNCTTDSLLFTTSFQETPIPPSRTRTT